MQETTKHYQLKYHLNNCKVLPEHWMISTYKATILDQGKKKKKPIVWNQIQENHQERLVYNKFSSKAPILNNQRNSKKLEERKLQAENCQRLGFPEMWGKKVVNSLCMNVIIMAVMLSFPFPTFFQDTNRKWMKVGVHAYNKDREIKKERELRTYSKNWERERHRNRGGIYSGGIYTNFFLIYGIFVCAKFIYKLSHKFHSRQLHWVIKDYYDKII